MIRCLVCGGEHAPKLGVCDDAGMDRQIATMGARQWNRITKPTRIGGGAVALEGSPRKLPG